MDTTDKGGTAGGGLCTVLMIALKRISVDGAMETIVYAVLGTLVGFLTTKIIKLLGKAIQTTIQGWANSKK